MNATDDEHGSEPPVSIDTDVDAFREKVERAAPGEPFMIDATLRDGRVSIDGTTRTASLTARPASHAPLSEDGVAARLHLADGDELDVEVSLKAADVTAIRDALEDVGAAEVFDGP